MPTSESETPAPLFGRQVKAVLATSFPSRLGMIMCWPRNKSKKNGLLWAIPENGTQMTFYSPFDDFVLNSLAAIASLLGKLDYVADLRQQDGCYRHWGLARVHGEEAAHQAAAQAHRLLFSKILSTPLASLLEDAAAQPEVSQGMEQYLEYLSRRRAVLAPQEAGEGPLLHFSSVLHAASALAHARNRTSPPAA
jgi:hypothetical protein